jgi:hypothetical protein
VGLRFESIACLSICVRRSNIFKVSNVGGGYNLDRRFPFGSDEVSDVTGKIGPVSEVRKCK